MFSCAFAKIAAGASLLKLVERVGMGLAFFSGLPGTERLSV